MRKSALGCSGVLGLLILGIVGIFPYVTFVVNSAWFAALGYSQDFNLRWSTQVELFLWGSIVTLVFLGGNWVLASLLPSSNKDDEFPGALSAGISAVISVIAALVVGFFSSGLWSDYILWKNTSPMGKVDPVFHQDYSYYMLQLPFEHTILNLALVVGVIGLVGVWLIHLMKGGETLPNYASRLHMGVVLAMLVFLVSRGLNLGLNDYLFSHDGIVQGAGYTAINASIPGQSFTAMVALIAALAILILSFVPVEMPQIGGGALALVLIPLIFAGAGINAGLVENNTVKNNQNALEKTYVQREIDATRESFGLNKVETRALVGDASVTPDAVAADADTMSNLRLWDQSTLHESNTALQSSSGYYDYGSVAVDRYNIKGKLQVVEISPRELDPAKLPDRVKTWVNLKFHYTHSYGFIANPANEVTATGDPTYLASGIPSTGLLNATTPQIYFGTGPAMQDYVLAPSGYQEYDHADQSSGNEVEIQYNGTHSPLVDQHRFEWAFATGDYNLWVSPQVTPKTQVLYRRDINSRLHALAPFLTYDTPYLITDGSRLYWMVIAMTSSSSYPYAQSEAGGVSYLSNSVKVVVDAYEGTANFYVWDENDPFVKAYSKDMTHYNQPKSAKHSALLSHIQYPTDLFKIQAAVYATYHNTNVQTFFDRSDVWSFATEQRSPTTPAQEVEPYSSVSRLPGESSSEFHMAIPLIPFTQSGKARTNLVAWMAVRQDPDHYGELVAITMPRDHTIRGPLSISSGLNTNPVASQDFTFLNQHGSAVEFGQMFVVPVGKGMLYFEPIYLKATNGSSQPQLKRVIVGDGTGRVGYGPSISAALANMFGVALTNSTPGSPSVAPSSLDFNGLLASMQNHSILADQALSRGDVVTYQQEMLAIKNIIPQLTKVAPAVTTAPATPIPSPTPSP